MKTEVDMAPLQPMNIISNNNFEDEILVRDKPVLLMCVPGGQVYAEQEQVLNQLSGQYRKMVDICCLEEDFINGFKKMYSIKGTPVFLLFHRGQEMGRMLGMADKERLEAFLDWNLPPISTRPS
jgi:thioredoxin-like negative regulator of GroEL